jgi:hypothetical protein
MFPGGCVATDADFDEFTVFVDQGDVGHALFVVRAAFDTFLRRCLR